MNTTLIPPVTLILNRFQPDVNVGLVLDLYPLILGAFVAAAGVRQWGKNTNVNE